MNKRVFYECDPNKNIACSKNMCKKVGDKLKNRRDYCTETLHHEFAKDGALPYIVLPKKYYDEIKFENVPTTNLTFGDALRAVQNGYAIAREGWNGIGMFIVFQKGYPQGISCNKQTAEAWGMQEGEKFCCNPYLQIKQTNGSHSMWVPSIGDCLATDWRVLV